MRWLLQAVFAVALIGAPGCVTNATIDALLDFPPNVVFEPVEVSNLVVRRHESSFEVAVLYGDGVLRRTTWEPGGELATWTAEESRDLINDTESERRLEELDDLAERGRWQKVIGGLDTLLLEAGDRVVRSERGLTLARDEARRRLLDLPPEGRETYGLLHDAQAIRLYEQGLETPGVEQFEAILAEHPASHVAPKVRRLLVSRYLEAARPDAARPHVELLLEGPLEEGERNTLTRLREQVDTMPAVASKPPWSPVVPDPAWPEGAVQPVSRSRGVADGLLLRGGQQLVLLERGRQRAVLDLRRMRARRRPLSPTEELSRAVRYALWALTLPVTVAADLGTWPIQFGGIIVYAVVTSD